MARKDPGLSFFPAQEDSESEQPRARVQGKNWDVAAIKGGYRATPAHPLGPGAHIAEISQTRNGRHFVTTRLFWVRGPAE